MATGTTSKRPHFSKEDLVRATVALFSAATRGETLANQVRAALSAVGDVENATATDSLKG